MWKTVLVGTESTVTLENGWLTVAQPVKSVRLPVDDVYSVVIDNPRCRCSVASMNALTQAGAHLVFCDEKHFPTAVVLPMARHYRADGDLREQISLPEEVRGVLWQSVVSAKIRNQIAALKLCGVPEERWRDLPPYAEKVQPHDARNVEAVVAKKYFRALFGPFFRRSENS